MSDKKKASIADRQKKSGNVPVKMLRTLRTGGGMYNKGEICGFPKETAEQLYEQKIARPYKDGDKSVAEADVKKKNKSADPSN